MSDVTDNQQLLQYYATFGTITDPGEYGWLFDGLPDDIPRLVKIVQGLIIHYGWTNRYGVEFSQERFNKDAHLRKVSR